MHSGSEHGKACGRKQLWVCIYGLCILAGPAIWRPISKSALRTAEPQFSDQLEGEYIAYETQSSIVIPHVSMQCFVCIQGVNIGKFMCRNNFAARLTVLAKTNTCRPISKHSFKDILRKSYYFIFKVYSFLFPFPSDH